MTSNLFFNNLLCRLRKAAAVALLLAPLGSGAHLAAQTYDEQLPVYDPNFPAVDQSSDLVELDDRMPRPENCRYRGSSSTSPIYVVYPVDVKITYYGYGDKTMYSSAAATPTGDPDVNVASSEVGIGIDAPYRNTFVYQLTLEHRKTDWTRPTGTTPTQLGRLPYRLIPNPFSRRPTHGSGNTRWRGFYKWRVKKLTGCSLFYTNLNSALQTTGTAINPGDMVDAEALIYIKPNAWSATQGLEIEFEAIWARAFVFTDVKLLDAATSGNYATGTNAYERNFVVPSGSGYSFQRNTSGWSDKDFTVTAVYPNGTGGSNNNLLTSIPNLTNLFSALKNNTTIASSYTTGAHLFASGRTVKFEYIKLSGGNYNDGIPIIWGSSFNLNGTNLVCGRCCLPDGNGKADDDGKLGFLLNYHSGNCYGYGSTVSTANTTLHIRLESGYFLTPLYLVSRSTGTNCSYRLTLGSDYDRYMGDNTRLDVSGVEGHSEASTNNPTFDYVVKSGLVGKRKFAQGTTSTNPTTGSSFGGSFYLGSSTNSGYDGLRTLRIEGGVVYNVAGGIETSGSAVEIEMTGGRVVQAVWGSANLATAYTLRRMVFTGGVVNGWISGGANVTNETGTGVLNNQTYIYFGGTARLEPLATNDQEFWDALGGNLYGAGCGNPRNSNQTAGQVNNSTVVVADQAVVARDVYGGGNYGNTAYSADVRILGGTVKGSVYGGSNQRGSNQTTVTVRKKPSLAAGEEDTRVLGNVYGGSNTVGTATGSITVNIEGGTIGDASLSPAARGETSGNVFGCGHGAGTTATCPVKVTIATSASGASAYIADPTILGSVYGGGHAGKYEAAAADGKIEVTTYNGLIHGSVFGGGLGTTATVSKNGSAAADHKITNVKILGHTTVLGNVYGGGNAGKVTGNTSVVIGD